MNKQANINNFIYNNKGIIRKIFQKKARKNLVDNKKHRTFASLLKGTAIQIKFDNSIKSKQDSTRCGSSAG